MAQAKIIHKIADNGSCVIVGWADGRHYSLSVDSSAGAQETADLILAYISGIPKAHAG